MSNPAVGAVYQSIIEEVISSSRVDFEEGGVDETVLEELRKVSHIFSSASSFPCVADGAFHHQRPRGVDGLLCTISIIHRTPLLSFVISNLTMASMDSVVVEVEVEALTWAMASDAGGSEAQAVAGGWRAAGFGRGRHSAIWVF
jgi:hypothetical protein